MPYIKLFFACGLLLLSTYGITQENQPKKHTISQYAQATESVVIDGRLSEHIWQNANWTTDFIQRSPDEGKAPSLQTRFAISHDTKYLYIGILNEDASVDKIERRASRRDIYDGDWVEVAIDSYFDLRTAFVFGVTSSGIRVDRLISENGEIEDLGWNPIWFANAQINEEGWSAEMKIPLSQLRFSDEQTTWGLQVVRRIFREEELSVWQRIPLDAPGWVSEFGELHFEKAINARKQLEIQPYLVSSVQTFEKEPSNPFRNKNQLNFNVGLDGKIGLTNDFIMDFTVNPDFGQVEADPGAIAIDGFQLFFKDQRPFFVENSNIYDYSLSPSKAGESLSEDNVFYSRRIGRQPQIAVANENNNFVDSDERTSILGAMKLSGKTKNGWSIGVLESITGNEYATLSDNTTEQTQLIEPKTNYFVGRVQKDLNQRQTFIGGIVTSTIRSGENIGNLHRSSFVAGLDFKHQWMDRTWFLSLKAITSKVKGSQDAILNTQTSISHLFQRGADHLSLDSTRTFLQGSGGDIKIGKQGSGNINFESGIAWRSPQLEINDAGFMRQADDIRHYSWVTYRSIVPFGKFRSGAISFKHWLETDYGLNLNRIEFNLDAEGVFSNNWGVGAGTIYKPLVYKISALQGGPRIKFENQAGGWLSIASDSRKKLGASGYALRLVSTNEDHFTFDLLSLGLSYQPTSRLGLSTELNYSLLDNWLQFINSIDYRGSNRIVTGFITQEELSLSLRFDLSINANMSLQYYAQPFISVGKFKKLNTIDNPLAANFDDRINLFSAAQVSDEGDFLLIDEELNGQHSYQLDKPDFSYAQYRSNLVFRWEYIQGSELFLVWLQGFDSSQNPSGRLLSQIQNQLFANQPDRTFLVKWTYRFIR